MTLLTLPAPVVDDMISRRRFIAFSAASLGAAGVSACGSNEPAPVQGALEVGAGTPVIPQPATPIPTPTPTPSPAPDPSGALASLRLVATQAGTWPYVATVLPLQGHVPAGKTLASPDDTELRASVLSTWQDGSAAVMVVAGRLAAAPNDNRNLRLQLADPIPNDLALGAARVGQLMQAVRLDFGSWGIAQITDFSRPERIWWANAQTVCARYRVPAPGHPALEAVVDIQAFAADHALVEVVVENGKLNSGSPLRPESASYAAVLSINGVSVATVDSAGAAEASHSAFRAWHASHWVGGNPGVRATQSHAQLQQHPLLFKCDQASNADLAVYATDTYVPWGTGRHRARGMGAGGDHPSIGPLPLWETQALQTGDPRAWRAVEASALATLSYNVNYRDISGGVPTFAQIGTRFLGGGGWPGTSNVNDAVMWQTAHCPAVGLMAFVSRPSPVFIEIAQKVAVWNGSWSGASTPNWTSGTFGYWYEIRGKAWGIRSLTHAAFLTPNADAWRVTCMTAISNNVTLMDGYRTNNMYALGMMCDNAPENPWDHEAGTPGFQQAVWMHHYVTTELHKLASAKLLSGVAQSSLETLADWCAQGAVRWVSEQPNGGWRYIPYKTTLGDNATTINSQPTWESERNRPGNHRDAPNGVRGPWMTSGGVPTTYAEYISDNAAGAYYPSYFWAALTAAVERGLPGANQAWTTVALNVSNLGAWRSGFAADPRWSASPRNL